MSASRAEGGVAVAVVESYERSTRKERPATRTRQKTKIIWEQGG